LSKFKIALSLGGGGVRGLAHIGVIKVLHENGIKPSFVVGTSMGAIVGALYSATLDPDKVLIYIEKLLGSKEFENLKFDIVRNPAGLNFIERFFYGARQFFVLNVGFMGNSILPKELSNKIIKMAIPYNDFSELKIPFYVVATDISKGEKVVMSSGDLKKAILSSISIPGIFPPVNIDNRLLVDGASVSYTPCKVAKDLKADFVLGVEVRPNLRRIGIPKKGLDVIFRASDITGDMLHQEELKYADFVLQPKVKNVHWANFKKYKFCIAKGEEEAKKFLNDIKKQIRVKKFRSFFKI